MKKVIASLGALTLSLSAAAQDYSSSFNALRLPADAHVAALGGYNVSMVGESPTAGWTNPALYANAAPHAVSLDFMTYMGGSQWMGAGYAKAFGQRHTLGVGVHLMNYGSMDETDETGSVTGTFRAKDFILGGGYSYLLSDKWSGGANLKLIFSNIASYSSIAMAVDLGINYYDEERDLSLSAALANIGTQLKAYDEGLRTHLPFRMDVGVTKGLDHIPVRIHVTATDITRWNARYFTEPDGKDEKVSLTKKVLNHVVLGLDVLPTDNVYLALGYNFRRAYELKASGSSHWAGISAGAGLQTKRFDLSLSYAKYHQAGNSFMAGATFKI